MIRLSLFALGLTLLGLVNTPPSWVQQSRAAIAASAASLWMAVAPKESETSAPLVEGVSSKVIFRDPASWSSSLWIRLGMEDNEAIGRIVIAQNSPVLAKGALIGVVEYVGRRESRVRLVTDSGLVPAVRAVRGGMQNRELLGLVQGVLERLKGRLDLFASNEEQARFLELVTALQERISPLAHTEWSAKGELHGCSAPLWRSRGLSLKGVGFNYNYPDARGPAKILSPALLREGDLLITSGLDGVFPEGIPVAFVTSVAQIKPGGFSYELEAQLAAGDLYDLQSVQVLSPIECMHPTP